MTITSVTQRLAEGVRLAAQPHILRGSLQVSLVVGVVLNAVNQGSALRGRASISWPHLLMNFAVPFCVASYGAARAELAQRRRHQGGIEGDAADAGA